MKKYENQFHAEYMQDPHRRQLIIAAKVVAYFIIALWLIIAGLCVLGAIKLMEYITV